jgi:hypothetical protein
MEFTCHECGVTGTDPTGWTRAQLTCARYLGPDSVGGDERMDVLCFHTDACRDACLARVAPAPEPAA